MDELIH